MTLKDWARAPKYESGRPYGVYIVFQNKKNEKLLIISEIEDPHTFSVIKQDSEEEFDDVDENYIKDCKTEKAALKFAKSYMRKN